MPTATVVVPTRGRPEALRRCVDALLAQRTPPGFHEIVVVQDEMGSTPALPDQVTVLRQDPAGPAVARNRGARAARGRWLLFTDDDCVADADWVSALVAACEREPEALVGGRVVNSFADAACADASHLMLEAVCSAWNADVPTFHPSNNIAMARTTFLALGGFDETFPLAAGEDRDLCLRWRAAGLPLGYAPDAVVHHRHAMTAPGFLRQQYRYGRGAWQVHVRHGTGAGGPGSLRLQGRILGWPLRRRTGARAATATALVVAGLAANAVGWLRERIAAPVTSRR